MTEKKKASTSKYEPTLDYKGRINQDMMLQYSGLYHKVRNRKLDDYEDEKSTADRVAQIFLEFEHKRAPQLSSKSMSPYLLANSFNFDVTEIMLEIREARTKEMVRDRYRDYNKH